MVRIRRFSVVKTATVVALMYMVIVAVFAIPFFLLFAVTGVSVNPARSIGPAVWVLGDALPQVWLFIAALLIWPIVHVARSVRARRWQRLGRCFACGYDLRATPQRCPECGATSGTVGTIDYNPRHAS